MKHSNLMVAGLMLITTSSLAGCSSTSSPTSTGSSHVQTSISSSSVQSPTSSSGVQTPTSSGVQSPTSSGVQSSTSSSIRTPTTDPGKTTSSPVPAPGANLRVATCQTQHLTLTQGRVGVATGSTYVTYYLQNRGPGKCSMLGYPGFSLLFANGSVIQHPANRDQTAYSLVQLAPGRRVRFVVRTVDASIAGTGCSTSWKSAKVQVYPPNQRTPIRQPSTIAACDLTVGPVSAASS